MDPRIERTFAFVETHLGKPVQLGDMASEAGLSPFHFHRLFKIETGETPRAYVNRVRLKRAAHLLVLYPGMPQIEIALKLGYSSPAAFARAFRAQYDISPLKFRARQLAKSPNGSGKMAESEMPVTYLNAHKVLVTSSQVDEKVLTKTYQGLMANNLHRASHILGIFVDAPFHTGRDKCQHFIALDRPTKSTRNTLTIEGGYYTHFPITGNHDAAGETILGFYKDKIVPSAYDIGSPVFFEKVKIPEIPRDFVYERAARELFIAIKRK